MALKVVVGGDRSTALTTKWHRFWQPSLVVPGVHPIFQVQKALSFQVDENIFSTPMVLFLSYPSSALLESVSKTEAQVLRLSRTAGVTVERVRQGQQVWCSSDWTWREKTWIQILHQLPL